MAGPPSMLQCSRVKASTTTARTGAAAEEVADAGEAARRGEDNTIIMEAVVGAEAEAEAEAVIMPGAAVTGVVAAAEGAGIGNIAAGTTTTTAMI